MPAWLILVATTLLSYGEKGLAGFLHLVMNYKLETFGIVTNLGMIIYFDVVAHSAMGFWYTLATVGINFGLGYKWGRASAG